MSTSSIAVLHIFGRLNHGGAELRTIEALEYLKSQGRLEQQDVVVLSGLPGDLDSRWTAAGGRIHYVPLVAQPWRLGQMYRLIRHLNPSVLHSHVALFSGVLVALARLARIPIRIAHFRSNTAPPSGRLYDWIVRSSLAWGATRLVGVSSSSLEGHLGAEWSRDPRTVVCFNGINTAAFVSASAQRGAQRQSLGATEDTVVIITVGRMEDIKRHELLVKAMRPVLEKNSTVQWWVVGRNDTAHAKEIVFPLFAQWPVNLQSRVQWLGVRDDIPALLAASDLKVFGSRIEGLPGVTLEALASGLSVIASDIAPHREIKPYAGEALHLIPAEASSDVWVATIEKEVGILTRELSERGATRHAFQAVFSRSPFQISSASERLEALWTPFSTPS